ncbi:hypothetical protein AMTR_s00738p00011360 [Amborella trichopoda]|uniref:Uncharacterized protein n=1 Tax=Amborella trichopoda TaxID=13333 RepID=W1NVY6_AMBTC|nr:hypothetical protein AMTR_s00738p00011360 [Amborella trichopoda]
MTLVGMMLKRVNVPTLSRPSKAAETTEVVSIALKIERHYKFSGLCANSTVFPTWEHFQSNPSGGCSTGISRQLGGLDSDMISKSSSSTKGRVLTTWYIDLQFGQKAIRTEDS